MTPARSLAAAGLSAVALACAPSGGPSQVASPTRAVEQATPAEAATSPAAQGSDALPDLGLPRATVTLAEPGERDGVAVEVLVASGLGERSRGLMGVTSLPRQAGMLFRFPTDVRSGFYMKDTLLPLSIAFADAGGEVLEVLDMDPCRQEPCRVYEPGVSYRSALEVNQGFFEDIGLRPGWRIIEPADLPPAT